MKLTILNLTKTEIGKRELPSQFDEEIRADLVKRAVLTIRSNSRQAYGADPMAGKRASAELSRRRHKYRGSYGFGISRVPRKILSRRGTRLNWVGAFAPGTVKGRRAHPPKADKIWSRKLNTKERRKAIRSALSATVIKPLVQERGHIVPELYPFIIDSKIESMEKTKDVISALEKLGFAEELSRVSVKSIRPGKGTLRGRKYRKKTGPLIIVSDKCSLMKSAKNIPGVDIVKVDKLNAGALAQGIRPGRLSLFTDKAIERMEKEQLFMDKEKSAKPKGMDEKKPRTAAKAKDAITSVKKAPAKKPAPAVIEKPAAEVKNAPVKKDEKGSRLAGEK